MKRTGIFMGLIVIIGVVLYFVLAQPKLEANLLGTGLEQKVVVITLGNDGFQDIELLDIRINGAEKPEIAKVQVDESGKGFVLSDTFMDEGYIFKDYDTVKIETGTAIKDVESQSKYGLSVKDDVEINSVTILYKYLGIEFEENVQIN
ncbi:hypothetical protein [Peribacillus butanolivorans]|uniref:hypothetical protein n=1 Tax=Peribacillus butanolivorans TaxID=421767 RepID=UPI0038309DBD